MAQPAQVDIPLVASGVAIAGVIAGFFLMLHFAGTQNKPKSKR
jgi:hypothetical protein